MAELQERKGAFDAAEQKMMRMEPLTDEEQELYDLTSGDAIQEKLTWSSAHCKAMVENGEITMGEKQQLREQVGQQEPSPNPDGAIPDGAIPDGAIPDGAIPDPDLSSSAHSRLLPRLRLARSLRRRGRSWPQQRRRTSRRRRRSSLRPSPTSARAIL